MPSGRARGGAEVLRVDNLHAHYGESHVLDGISLAVHEGEIVSLLGRNGAGKSTTLKSIMGIVASRSGSIRFNGTELIDKAPEDIARLGIGYCPEDRGIFASLNVRENLLLPPVVRSGGMTLPQIFELFPNIAERLGTAGTALSGGEQQMLAIARILRSGAALLLLDEPTEGLAPVIVHQIGVVLRRLKEKGFTVLLVEQNFRFATTVCDWHYIVENGEIVDDVSNDAAKDGTERLREHLGV